MNRRGAEDERAKRIAATQRHYGMTSANHGEALPQVADELEAFDKKAAALYKLLHVLENNVDKVCDGANND